MAKKLMKGNEALGEAAVQAGCRYFFGYPITPQNEIPAYLARRLPEVGGVFLQAESEVAAINMVYGAAGAGARVLTSSSSPGISLKTEGISYIAGAQLPCVIVNIVRGGPGLGGIQPAQSDYFQATKGGGHGDYRLVVLAPSTVQELVDLTMEAFDIADAYRTPVMILGDGIIGQMMEPVEFNPPKGRDLPEKTWATTGAKGRKPNVVNSLHMAPEELEKHNLRLQAKYREIAEKETKCEMYQTEDAEIILVAYGTTARICKTVVQQLRKEGIKVGLIRPITLWPYPEKAFNEVIDTAKAFLTVEMSTGQMVEDVRLAVNGRKPVHFYGRTGGMIPTPQEIAEKVRELAGGVK
ncbi:3-methyl-2-oxobutanoate dehydrogenase subunit VorB [Anaerobranca gottschalkii]|uniref:2-oxoglutarate ferredoxin oxidoreductase subunit alpha n=1 Tax=Anaerobranca gottschalkii DSM 13577 TaxID=1120990 RepID=A0A1H9Y199_9FIRM|nr:3-methyl-2-oxobutanoate dehydrogenase subunit VorB [Anaerobranca gottschalkii]SES62543.1 2-oxoglutarate ferredoxin oxidoreductase subunit alpha [Anaerobranca gottschalkii DSM 13577]